MIEFSEDEVSNDLLLEAAEFANDFYDIEIEEKLELIDRAYDAVFEDYRTRGEEWESLVVGYVAGVLRRGKKDAEVSDV